MATKIIEHGKAKFTSGLFWQTFSSVKDLKSEVKETAKKINTDLYAPRIGPVIQAGFAQSKDGAFKGTYSLALAVASYFNLKGNNARSWMCAIELPDGSFAYIASREDAFLPDSDISGPVEEIQAKMREDYAIGNWEKVFCPEGFYFPNSESISLSQLIPVKRGRAKVDGKFSIKDVIPKTNKILVGVAVASVILSIAGFKYYTQYKQDAELLEIQQRAMAAAKQKALEMQAQMNGTQLNNLPPPEHPWKSMAPTSQLLSGCLSKLRDFRKSYGGWSLVEYMCDGANFTYRFEKGVTPINYLIHDVPQAFVESDGIHATYSDSLNNTYQYNDDPLDFNTIAVNNIVTDMELIGVDLKLSEVVAPPKPQTDQNVPAPIPQWRTFNFNFSTAYNPDIALRKINRDGLRVTKVTYKPFGGSSTWMIDGTYYVSIKK